MLLMKLKKLINDDIIRKNKKIEPFQKLTRIGNSCDQFVIYNYGGNVGNLTPLFPLLPPQTCFQ